MSKNKQKQMWKKVFQKFLLTKEKHMATIHIQKVYLPDSGYKRYKSLNLNHIQKLKY